jgi:ubiquinone/menaquinone biosynthesis C-methylase UbiE
MGAPIEFDAIADCYDATRGGEQRGDEYAADIDALLPPTDGVILEIGVGTGVVALGLKRRGRRVIGVDLSQAMILRAFRRLGPTVARSDALQMSVATASIDHAVSVWVVHSVKDPLQLFHEARRHLHRQSEPAPGERRSDRRDHPGDDATRRRAEGSRAAARCHRRRGARLGEASRFRR